MLPQSNSCGDQMTTISEKTAELLSLEGKVAMVTGAASGIGRGIALRLAELGAAVVILDIDTKGSEATAGAITELGGKAQFQKCDVRSSRDCKAAVAKSAASFGKVDILCNNAGVVVRKGVTDLLEEEWDLVLDVTLKGIDGLVYDDHALIAIQNGTNPLRVSRYILNPEQNQITQFEIIDRKHPAFNEPTLGVVAGRTFYYIANSQWNGYDLHHEIKPDSLLQDIVILKSKLRN